MNRTRHEQSTENQIRKVYKHIDQYGSINRYEADEIGICHLAARVQDLEARGLVYKHIDENEVEDFHGITHNGIRRYFIDWKQMKPEVVEYFERLSND
jgi:hypothetical protein